MAEKAAAAVGEFMKRAGQKDTTIHETVAPAVVREQVIPTRHEEITTAVQKEIHQDHYHTSVQPVQDRQVLPEKHTHTVADVERRTFDHSDPRATQDRLASEAAQFKDERVIGDTLHTQSTAPTVAGQQVHHHIHETVQPIVQRETIQPTVIHTTIPVHEVYHNPVQHHAASALPAISMADFKAQGGTLGGGGARGLGSNGESK